MINWIKNKIYGSRDKEIKRLNKKYSDSLEKILELEDEKYLLQKEPKEQKECIDKDNLYRILKEGELSFHEGTICPYHEDDFRKMLHSYGWVKEELRCALIKAESEGHGKY